MRRVRNSGLKKKEKLRESRRVKKEDVWARTGIEASVSVGCVFGHMQTRSDCAWLDGN